MTALIIGLIASTATVIYHMIRPTFVKLRLSIAAFLPNPPKSDKERSKIKLALPQNTIPFWGRVFMFLSSLFALIQFSTLDFGNEFFESTTVRIVVDTSPSMSVSDGDGSRIDSAKAVLKDSLEILSGIDTVACVEIIAAGSTLSLLSKGSALNLLKTGESLTIDEEGAGVQILRSSITAELENSCETPPIQAVLVTDRPPEIVGNDVFAGRLLWYQVGKPIQNQAVSNGRILGGGLLGNAKLRVEVSFSGGSPNGTKLNLTGPNGISEHVLYQDSEEANTWFAEIQSPVTGEYKAVIRPGGALSNDDILYFSIPEIENIAVDWQIDDHIRPEGLIHDPNKASIVVGTLESIANLNDRAFVVTYNPKWSTGAYIGTFQHRHALLNDINFDVLESNSPGGISQLPDGFVPVMSGIDQSVWVAVRENSRGAIVPSLKSGNTEDQHALATTLFFNGLDWVSNSKHNPNLNSYWLTNGGKKSTKLIAEYNTNRELIDPPNLSDLALPVDNAENNNEDEEQPEYLEWWLLIAILFLLIDRFFGLNWRRA